MRIIAYLGLLKKIGFNRLFGSFIGNFGFLWLLAEPGALFFPEQLDFGWIGYFWLALASLGIAFLQKFPRISVSQSMSSPDTSIEIRVGNLFDQAGHLVIGFNDAFNTELGELIKPSSIQGQFLERIYKNDRSRMDEEIENALQKYKCLRTRMPPNKPGKIWRYPIGTIVTLGSHGRRYFLAAYGKTNNEMIIQSNVDCIWTTLSKLWREVRLKGDGDNVSIPIVGADLARTGLPRMMLAKLIAISFLTASKDKFVSRKLTIMIYPNDMDLIDFYELDDFLKSTCF